MESNGTVNINVQNNFLKLWYKKNKITLQDISLTNQEGPTRATKKVLAGKIIAKYEVESKVGPIEAYEENPQEGYKSEVKEPNDSNEDHVEESKPEKPSTKDDIYHHPRHLEKQKSSSQGHGN
jgi:hypothetical protein